MKHKVAISISAFLAMTAVSNPGMAETVDNYIAKQAQLDSLDHSIERYERLIKLGEAEYKLENIGKEGTASQQSRQTSRSNQPQRYFEPSTEGDVSNQTGSKERRESSKEEEKRRAARIAKETELNLMKDAEIVEVFRTNGLGSGYGAVLKVDGRAVEVEPGDKVSEWKIAKIGLGEITVKNQRYTDSVMVIKQIR